MELLGVKRGKVKLEPGHSAMDWAALTRSGKNLRGSATSFMKVTRAELQQHKKPEDAWTVIHGKVYNITPYLKFHPGGSAELMKVAGKDGTTLFNKHHAWVNYEHLLKECLVGVSVP